MKDSIREVLTRIQPEFWENVYCGACCGSGWFFLLKDLIIDLSRLYREADLPPSLRIVQIKEKFGGLRFYVDCDDVPEDFREKVYARISEAESLSLRTCENCGHPGTPGGKGWVKTLCSQCRALDQIERGWHDKEVKRQLEEDRVKRRIENPIKYEAGTNLGGGIRIWFEDSKWYVLSKQELERNYIPLRCSDLSRWFIERLVKNGADPELLDDYLKKVEQAKELLNWQTTKD